MYKICFNQAENPYELHELVRMFLPPSSFTITDNADWERGDAVSAGDLMVRIPDGVREKNEGKRFLYDTLSAYTGITPDWGILTGVRPVKLTGEVIRRAGSKKAAFAVLTGDYRLKTEKADLLLSTWETQQGLSADPDEKAVGLYIGIPFCPTRCVYCSFPSYQADGEKIAAYLVALFQEIEFTAAAMKQSGIYAETLYIGGGTPTTLAASALDALLTKVRDCFDLSVLTEFTVEAGRPDTITPEKLRVIKKNGAERISINPQSMKAETLVKIGRQHTPDDIRSAYESARKIGFQTINMDLIAGLPEEEESDFINTLQEILRMKPENITVHTLAVKRASRLRTLDEDYNYHQGKKVGAMLAAGAFLLKEAGYRPYYLYRQKQMTGNFENVGYTLPGYESLYNVRVMEEDQSVIALGAGGISKIRYPAENRLERIPNVSNYEIYIEKIDEMIERKREGIFK